MLTARGAIAKEERVKGDLEVDASQDRKFRDEQARVALALAADFPSNDDALYFVGLVFNHQGASDRAMEYWRRSLALDSTRADAHHDLGYALLLREEFDSALQHLGRAVELQPRNEEYHTRLAHGRLLAGRYAEALAGLDSAGITSPFSQRLRGQAHHRLGQYQKAKRAYETAVRLEPDFAEAYYGLALACARLGDRQESARRQKRFNELKSEKQIRGRRMRSDFDPLAETRRNVAHTHTDAARVYANLGNAGQAEKLWLRAAEIDPGNTDCRFYLAMLYHQTDRNEEALSMCRKMIEAQPDNGAHYLTLGNLQRRQGLLDEAERSYRQLMKLAPARPEGYFALAQLLLQMRKGITQAVQHAHTAVRLSPSAAGHFVLARACAANADYRAALTSIEEACRLAPENPQYRELRDQLRLRITRLQQQPRDLPSP